MNADTRVKVRLSVMMALVYSVQGAFWPMLSMHLLDLGVSERGRGWIFATMALASFIMPLGAGQLVDRLMPTQKFLTIAFGIGTGLLALMAWGVSTHVGWLFGLFLVYWLILAPSYSLSGSIAFRNLAHPIRDFGKVRLWGTIGWMVVGWLVSVVMVWSGPRLVRGVSEAFWVASALSGLTAIYCWTLPNTPPLEQAGRKTSSLGDVLELVRAPGMATYLMVAFGVSLTTPFVYQVMPNYLRAIGMDRAMVPSAMSLGQWPEVLALAVLPWLLRRVGYRTTLAMGIGAYAIRFGSLAMNPPLWLATAGIPLHGIGVACFSIGGQVFVNGQAPADRRASAQSINTVVAGGLGSFLGSLIAGEVVRSFPGRFDLVFLIPFAINVGLLVVFLSRFRPAEPSQIVVPGPLSSVGRTARPTLAGSPDR